MRSKFPSVSLADATLALSGGAMINLLASGMAEVLLANLRCPVIMAGNALAEVDQRCQRDNRLTAGLERLKASELLSECELSKHAKSIWRDLVGDGLADGIDDGDAATIALALTHANDTVSVLDEPKSARVLAQRWPDRVRVDTVTVLAQSATRGQIELATFRQGCIGALEAARMRVPDEAKEWMMSIVGAEYAARIK